MMMEFCFFLGVVKALTMANSTLSTVVIADVVIVAAFVVVVVVVAVTAAVVFVIVWSCCSTPILCAESRERRLPVFPVSPPKVSLLSCCCR